MQCVHGQRKTHGFERHRPHSKRCGRGGRFIRVLDGRPMILLLKIGLFLLPMIVSFNVYNHQKKIAVAS